MISSTNNFVGPRPLSGNSRYAARIFFSIAKGRPPSLSPENANRRGARDPSAERHETVIAVNPPFSTGTMGYLFSNIASAWKR
jgi:hypothetical protein